MTPEFRRGEEEGPITCDRCFENECGPDCFDGCRMPKHFTRAVGDLNGSPVCAAHRDNCECDETLCDVCSAKEQAYWSNYFGQNRGTKAERKATLNAMRPIGAPSLYEGGEEFEP